MGLEHRMHWLVFDQQGRKQLRIRGAVWLNRDTLATEILGNPNVTHQANSIAALAAAAGLPAGPVQATIDHYNNAVATGKDVDFGRFDLAPEISTHKNRPQNRPQNQPQNRPQNRPISKPPFFAMRLLPMTRKSMGGLAIDTNAQVIGPEDRPIAGLFAAGEATGVAGINGSHGGSGTFLAPSVLTGRIAGRNAAASAQRANTTLRGSKQRLDQPLEPTETNHSLPMMTADDVRTLLKQERAGYWHWARSHATVLERTLICTDCHSRDWPTIPAMTAKQKMLKLDTCTHCH